MIVFAFLSLEHVKQPLSSENSLQTIDVEIIVVEPPPLIEPADVPSEETPESQLQSPQKHVPDRENETAVANSPPSPTSDDAPIAPRIEPTDDDTALDIGPSTDQIKPSTYRLTNPPSKPEQSEAGNAAVLAIRQIQCAKTGANRPTYCDDEIVWAANEYPALEDANEWKVFKKEETFLDTEAARIRARGCLNNGTGFAAGEGPIVARTEDYIQGPGKTVGRPAGKKKNRYFCD